MLTKQNIIDIISSKMDNSINSFDQFPKAEEFKNLVDSVNLFIEHLNKGSKILLIHDSDADGCGCYMISHIFFKKYYNYQNVELVITDRKLGYGFQPYHINDRINQLPNLVITSDNGITSNEAVDLCNQYNIDVIITDHHQVDKFKGVPNTKYVIDPHQSDCNFPFPDINGSLVYWYFINHLYQTLGGSGNLFYEFLPELMLTTVSDVMPLLNINRFIVKEGLRLASNHHRQWIKSFIETTKKDCIDTDDLGFNLIPAINAAARMANAEEAAIFLTQEDRETSMKWLMYLKELNDTRKAQQEELIKYIKANYQSWIEHPFILIPGTDFKKGLLGPIAGRLAEEYKKPTIVMTQNNNSYSGSGRSVGNINMLDLIKDNQFTNQLKTGGHKAACGVSLTCENLNNFWFQLQEDIKKVNPKDYEESSKNSLGYLELDIIDNDLYNSIEQFQPFGKDFERPQFESTAKITSAVKMGKEKNHYRLVLEYNDKKYKAVQFFFTEELSRGYMIDFVFTIMPDYYDESELVLHIKRIKNKYKEN